MRELGVLRSFLRILDLFGKGGCHTSASLQLFTVNHQAPVMTPGSFMDRHGLSYLCFQSACWLPTLVGSPGCKGHSCSVHLSSWHCLCGSRLSEEAWESVEDLPFEGRRDLSKSDQALSSLKESRVTLQSLRICFLASKPTSHSHNYRPVLLGSVPSSKNSSHACFGLLLRLPLQCWL